jgi:hypothetical protein
LVLQGLFALFVALEIGAQVRNLCAQLLQLGAVIRGLIGLQGTRWAEPK